MKGGSSNIGKARTLMPLGTPDCVGTYGRICKLAAESNAS
jgi:hypothetical protein